eukprot:GFUD01067373.1.p1 GENE.GFUD01067373.1~~GFUD01067373.1.p1  ORF type:complete len:472 (+),score=108.11 GFUD01067373.1:30-1445(+)
MGGFKIVCLLSVISALIVSVLLFLLCEDRLLLVPVTPVVPDRWWGKGEGGNVDDEKISEFLISVSEDTISELRSRIISDLPRLSPALEDSAFNYGFNTKFLKDIARYWLEEFDWQAQETLLNSFPQFITNIDGLDIHYLHVKPSPVSGQKVVPLLLVHGWPGSIVEFLDIIPLLTAGNEEVALEIIAPSIPGYGFSSAPGKPGFNSKHAAQIFKKLMVRLGHEKFYCQGGDWGSFITTNLATLFPSHVLGLHVNMGGVISPGGMMKNLLVLVPGMKYLLVDKEDMEKVSSLGSFYASLLRESGYFHQQATKPDTVGVGLSSSPLGLAAYILEKFSTWTNPDWTRDNTGGLEGGRHPIKRDRMLTNVMLYWVTNSITSSMRFYKENFPLLMDRDISRIPIEMPVGFADFPKELYRAPKYLISGKFPHLIQYTRMPRGGHFAAMEEPQLLAEDIIKFINTVEEKANFVAKQEF